MAAYWQHVRDSGLSGDYKKKVFSVARSFIEALAIRDLIPLPKNIRHRRHRFSVGPKAIPTFTVAEVRRMVDNAPGQLRLHLMLMANCGMTQIDVSDLLQSEVDWAEGRIIRKRSKESDEANVPIVNYKLWPQTWELLQHHRQTEGDRVLLTQSGKTWIRDELGADGKRHKTDAIKSNYRHLQRKLGIDKPIKLLRKTSAAILESHEHYGRYVVHFLGQSPRGVAARHYAPPSKVLFDEILAWLGRQYGFLA